MRRRRRLDRTSGGVKFPGKVQTETMRSPRMTLSMIQEVPLFISQIWTTRKTLRLTNTQVLTNVLRPLQTDMSPHLEIRIRARRSAN